MRQTYARVLLRDTTRQHSLTALRRAAALIMSATSARSRLYIGTHSEVAPPGAFLPRLPDGRMVIWRFFEVDRFRPAEGVSSANWRIICDAASGIKLLNVSVRSAQRARYVKDHGVPCLVHAVEQGDVKVAAAAEFTKTISPQDQARLIDVYGSPASAVKAAVKAKSDRASVWKPRPVPDPKAAADRAERRSQRHRERHMQIKRLLEAGWALYQSGNAAHVARSMLLLEAREAKSTISRLRWVAAFANDVAIWLERANTGAVLPQHPDAREEEGDVTP